MAFLSRPTPAGTNLTNVAKIVNGADHACAILKDQSVMCWGENDQGQLGDGTRSSRGTPLPVDVGGPVIQLALGDLHTCALVGPPGSAVVKCWGNNDQGRLGDGTGTRSSVPVTAAITGATAISAGASHTCAIDAAQNVQCWGAGEFGALGDASGADSLVRSPCSCSARSAPSPRSVAWSATFAQLANGTMVGWGYGCDGTLGSRRPVAARRARRSR
jgi:alpha-tubulin suppressor-like RCC1 family protein